MVSPLIVRSGISSVAAMAVAALLPSQAIASSDHDPLWYFNDFDYAAIHASGVTGEGVTIAVIDGPIHPDIDTLAGADVRVQESTCLTSAGTPQPGVSSNATLAGHGTQVVSLLVGTGADAEGALGVKGVAPGATVLTYAVYLPADGECFHPGQDGADLGLENAIAAAIEDALDNGADIISVSLGAKQSEALVAAMTRTMREGKILVAALSNDTSSDLGVEGYPGAGNGVVSVLSADRSGTLALGEGTGQPNTSPYVVVVAPGVDILAQVGDGQWQRSTVSGTSYATPIVAGNLALVLDKYPGATGNQAVQSLVHNTGIGPHELSWDAEYGYGLVVPATLLAANPSVYPDANLLIDDPRTETGAFRVPLGSEIFPDGEPTTEPSATGDAHQVNDPVGPNLTGVLLLGLAALVVLAVIITVTVVISRKRNT